MKYMITWKVPPEHYKQAQAVLKTGAPTEGSEVLGRWHAAGSTPAGTSSRVRRRAHGTCGRWAELLELQITPVVEDM